MSACLLCPVGPTTWLDCMESQERDIGRTELEVEDWGTVAWDEVCPQGGGNVKPLSPLNQRNTRETDTDRQPFINLWNKINVGSVTFFRCHLHDNLLSVKKG